MLMTSQKVPLGLFATLSMLDGYSDLKSTVNFNFVRKEVISGVRFLLTPSNVQVSYWVHLKSR